ncbi:DNA gyrase [Ellagibacter isourolithinifaciens]|uniref:DNA gyrase n=1 Tax=Ellagibacter isourolithinifaciens TaxID=2137581 RepID=UPI0023EF74D2|nr:DNA gyrase [Ellagibacter isourolithinifaciens]MDD5925514.1 DNA gyrase [Ellagibacter isourolithinifaciens]
MEDRKTVYITIHRKFVREDIGYTDRATGEERTFNSVTLPKDTLINGEDLSYYEFNPLFVNPSRFKGENYRDIPLQVGKDVRLSKTVRDAQGDIVTDAEGRAVKDIVWVHPEDIKKGLAEAASRYVKSLGERAEDARTASKAVSTGAAPSRSSYQRDRGAGPELAREDIPF